MPPYLERVFIMKQTVTESMFIDSFVGGYKDNFSYEGKKALFEYIEMLDDDCGTESELDPIALCCEYSEYEDARGCIEDCGYDFDQISEDYNLDPKNDPEEIESACMDWLKENTQVIEHDKGIIIEGF